MTEKPIIAGIGEILWDVFPERKVLGGAPANFAYHISQFGLNGYAVSAVGDDASGKEILAQLKGKKLHCLIETVDYPTGTVQVTLDGEGVPQYEICENVAWDHIPFSAATGELARKSEAVCFGSLAQRNANSRKSILEYLASMPIDSLKIFDINLRQHYYSESVIHDSLVASNVLKINDEEVVLLSKLYGWDGIDEVSVCKRLMEQYTLKIVILTKGSNGSAIISPEGISFLETPRVVVADTVGAGDSFTAAFVAGWLMLKEIRAAHKLAVEVAAYVCTQHGAMPELPLSLLKPVL